MKKIVASVSSLLLAFIVTIMLAACPTGPVPPKVDADAAAVYLDASGQVTSGVCSLIQGITSNGVVRSICATVDEVLQIVGFITTLRQSTDAGPPARTACTLLPLPNTTFCATSQEVADGILFVTHERLLRHMIDGGGGAR